MKYIIINERGCMKTKARFLLLLSFCLKNMQAYAEEVKEVMGIPIPENIVAEYDELDDIYAIIPDVDNLVPVDLIILNFIVIKEGAGRMFQMWGYRGKSFQHSMNFNIYVKNGKEIFRYSTGDVSPEKEYKDTYTTYTYQDMEKELEDFLIRNVKKDSQITLRVKGNEYKEHKLSKKEVEQLLGFVEFYKKLQSKIQILEDDM